MSPKDETHPNDQQAKSATTTVDHTSTSTEKAKPSTSNQSSTRRCLYADRAGGQEGIYSLQRWLQQSDKDDPWTATPRSGGRRDEGSVYQQNGADKAPDRVANKFDKIGYAASKMDSD
ncbi:hypothetical protein G7Y79_00002g006860 [Physcia stellaris]|nr:hypothetical protein G7Y79_00002g006860 [Physcia stellaris]